MRLSGRYFGILLVFAAMLSMCAAKDEFQAGDFVKQHLNSIGTEPTRAAVKNQLVQGDLSFQYLTVAGVVNGTLQFVSEGNKLVSVMKIPSPDYRGEQFTSDGQKVSIKQPKPGVYSSMGRFVFEHDEVLTEGLWGGTLSTAWALSHFAERHAKLQDQGIKTVDGRDLHRVDYIPKKHSDLEIQLYFEPETARHVLTVYSYSVQARAGGGPTASANQEQRRYRLEERFADFKDFDGLSLPSRWTIVYNPGGSGRTVGPGAASLLTQFEATNTKVSHNITLDPKNFEIK
jgi:hypothetical protein